MHGVVTALSRHQEAAKARQGAAVAALGAGGEGTGYLQGEGPVLSELQELAERMACTAVDAQNDHPIGFRRYSTQSVSILLASRRYAMFGCLVAFRTYVLRYIKHVFLPWVFLVSPRLFCLAVLGGSVSFGCDVESREGLLVEARV